MTCPYYLKFACTCKFIYHMMRIKMVCHQGLINYYFQKRFFFSATWYCIQESGLLLVGNQWTDQQKHGCATWYCIQESGLLTHYSNFHLSFSTGHIWAYFWMKFSGCARFNMFHVHHFFRDFWKLESMTFGKQLRMQLVANNSLRLQMKLLHHFINIKCFNFL